MAQSWCVLRCSGRSTLPLAASLSTDGLECWTPAETIRPRGKRGKLAVPMIPTFVFASARHLWTLVSLSEDPRSRHDGFSVMRHCGGRGYPLIDDAELEPLRIEERGKADEAHREALKANPPVFTGGDQVECPERGFLGLSGIVESADRKYAWVRFPGFNQTAKIATFLLRPNGSNRLRSETDMAA